MYSYSVDPTNIPKHLSNPQLEYFILFGILVAGKGAQQTAQKLDAFLEENAMGDGEMFPEGTILTPFETVRMLIYFGELHEELEEAKFGQYKRIIPAFVRAVELDVENLTVEALEAVPGIGPKTARMVMLYSDPNFDGVPLDTHILKYLKWVGYKGVPKSTPPAGKKYDYLEGCFRVQAKIHGKTIRELDTEVWKAYNSGHEQILSSY